MGRQWLHRAVVFAALIVAALSYTETTNAQDAQEEAMRNSSGVSEVPSARTKVLSAYSGALSLSAATWGAPLVIMYALRYHDAVGPDAKAAPNAIWRMEDISTPELSQAAGYVTPNVNTLYGFGFLDLAAQPIILTVPDSKGRYYMVEIVDFWTNAFAYVGGVATGYKGGKFALVGPGWKGRLPPGARRIDAPTRWVLIQPRVHVAGRDDLPAAKAVLDAITVEGLAEAGGTKAPAAPAYHYAAPEFSDAKLSVSALAFRDPLQFWEILAEALIENAPPPDQISALLPLFEPLGIMPGKPWDRSRIDPVVTEAMARVAKGLGTTLALLPGATFRNGWRWSAPTIGDFGTDYLTRARTARNGLTANTPREAIYIGGFAGSDGKPLSGSNRYAVTFKVLPPFVEPGFWSLSLYDSANNYTVPNPINRYALGSDDKTLKLNADGSLTIYLQKDSPGPAKEANWLPAPSGQYYLILRAYAPGEALMRSQTEPDGFPLPPINLVE
jgi:DNA sulfur modification protein DndE